MLSNVMHAIVMVQGTAKLPDEIEPQIHMVLGKIVTEKLETMTDEEFETLKVTFENDLLQPPKGFSDEIDYYWPIVARGNTCPDKRLQELDFLRYHLKHKKQLVEAWQNLVMPGQSRQQVVVKYFSQDLKEIPERPTQKEFQNALHPLDIPAKALHRTLENHEAADILSEVDSKARHEVLRKANHHFFPTELDCKYEISKTSFVELEGEETSRHPERSKRSSAAFLDSTSV